MKKIYDAVIPAGGWSDKFAFSPAVRAGNLLYISGMTSADEKGVLIGPGNIVRQTEYIFEKMGRILAASWPRPARTSQTLSRPPTTTWRSRATQKPRPSEKRCSVPRLTRRPQGSRLQD